MLRAGPDRLWSSEDFDVASEKGYHVDGNLVLNKTQLGDSVTSSNLSKLGTLTNLSVQGEAVFLSDINASRGSILAKDITLNQGTNTININSNGIGFSNTIAVSIDSSEVFYADRNEINIGNKNNTRRAVKIYGPLSVGVSNPDPNIEFAVNGNVSFAGRRFISGTKAPAEGNYGKGDICWNEAPASGSPIGWVCILSGGPGEWRPFGIIG